LRRARRRRRSRPRTQWPDRLGQRIRSGAAAARSRSSTPAGAHRKASTPCAPRLRSAEAIPTRRSPIRADEPAAAATSTCTPPPTRKSEADDRPLHARRRRLKDIELEGRFRELSALEDGDGEATNGAQIAARAREDEALAIRILRSEGYYDGTAVAAVEQVPEQPGQLRVVVTAIPGDRYTFGEISLAGAETVPAGLAREALPLKTGDPIVAASVEGAEASILLRLPEQGYPFAEIGTRDVLLDPENDRGDYTLPVTPGPRASFGGYTTEGDLAFDAEHVGVLARFERDELYDRRKVDDLREAMVATGLFSTVSAEPVRTGEVGPDGTEYVNILVRQDAGPPRALTGSAGYNTGEGCVSRAHGSIATSSSPKAHPRSRRWRYSGAVGKPVVPALERRASAIGPVLALVEAGPTQLCRLQGLYGAPSGANSRESTPIWQKRWTWAYGAELIATTRRWGASRAQPQRGLFHRGLIGQLGYDTSTACSTRPRASASRARQSRSVDAGTDDSVHPQPASKAALIIPVGESLVVAGRARFGSIFGIARDELAPSRRLYAGGGGSVRGFGFQQLGPRIEVANPKFDPEKPDKAKPDHIPPIGGRGLTEFSLEGRYRFGNYGRRRLRRCGIRHSERNAGPLRSALRGRGRRASLYQFRPLAR
jgi:translocation and assembly module TamA